ncbi:NnrU family protein [Ideonella sp.]|uniref:NnrU family protein n=1 Tax=Ideonella sp. TaxID=1929293 RepID=UPI0035AF883F
MTALVLGLLLFLGVHSLRIVAPAWREAQMARIGRNAWRGVYSLASLAGFVLLVWGYGQARQQPVVLWTTPTGLRHLAAPLVLVAFILLAASQVGSNMIQARLQHPMLLGTKLWAFAHLLANNTLADVLLFGGFLAWAVLCFRSARRRGPVAVQVKPGRTAIAVVAGVALWAFFAFWAHAAWIGVRPFG